MAAVVAAMLRRRLVLRLPGQAWLPGLLAWVLGTAAQLQQAQLFGGWHYAGLAALAVLVFLALLALFHASEALQGADGLLRRQVAPWLQRALWRLGLMLTVGALAFATTGLRAVAYQRTALAPALEGQDVDVVGVVAAMPQRLVSGQHFRLEVEEARLRGAPVQLPALMDVGWYRRADAIDVPHAAAQARAVLPRGPRAAGAIAAEERVVVAGERWRMRLRLKAPHGSFNPMGFDYELWLWEQGVQATAYVRTGALDPAPTLLRQTAAHPLERLRQAVSARLNQRLAEGHAPDERRSGVLAALLVGDQSAIDRADWDSFRTTGIAHLMSISGLHITMLAWAAGWLAARVWRRSGRWALWLPTPTAALAAALLTAVLYSVFSGWGVPAQRTCLMLATVGLLRLGGVQWPRAGIWLLALAVVVLTDPWALWQAGFWLSFVAVGLLFVRPDPALEPEPAPPPDAAVDRLGRSRRWLLQAAGRPLLALLREQGYISLALAPLGILLFGQVSLVGLLANLLAIPWVTLVVTPLALAGAVLPPAWDLAAWATGPLLFGVDQLAQWPMAAWALPRPGWLAGLAALAGGVWMALPQPGGMRLMGLPLLLPVLLAQPAAPATGEFTLLAPDIGQGNAVLVRTAGHSLLVDAGPRYSPDNDAGNRVLVPLLQALQWRLDGLLLTHRDTDHVGGAASVLALQPRTRVLAAPDTYAAALGWAAASSLANQAPPDAGNTDLLADDEASGGETAPPVGAVQPCLAGQQWQWDGVRLEVIYPLASDAAAAPKPNARTCVLRISNGRHAALLTGDIEQPQEALLLQRGQLGPVDVLLVPHHGSKTSSSAEFLDALQPRWALVQSGYRNRFGHPAASVLQRYAERHIAVRDSPHCGAMRWESAAPRQLACERELASHYWNHAVP